MSAQQILPCNREIKWSFYNSSDRTLIVLLTMLLKIVCLFLTVTSVVTSLVAATCSTLDDEEDRLLSHNEATAMYNYQTNVTEENRLRMIAVQSANANNSQTEFNELLEVKSLMQSQFAMATVCSYTDPKNCSLSLEPHIQERIENSRDVKELEHYWRQWHDVAGKPMKPAFTKYVQLSLKTAQLNNISSHAEDWIDSYYDPDFEENLNAVFSAILPLYRELHGYVRYCLRQHYGTNVVREFGNIPIHLLGNMWGETWDGVIDLCKPYAAKPRVNVTAEMLAQNYTVLKMFQLGDEFFQSLNMTKLPDTFWKKSVLEKPTDRVIMCHASAWDFFDSDDVCIKMCAEVSANYLYIVHHELGHLQYFLQYQCLSMLFRQAPNPGFQEAVGDLIALSVGTPKHLAKIGLAPRGGDEVDQESRVNELFKMALKKIVGLPFFYAIDKYRYAVFRGELTKEIWNCAFWEMRSQFAGTEPPIKRTEDDFDPPSKYHIAADYDLIRYFAAYIFQFQFLKAMCSKAGQYVKGDPKLTLDNCDFHGSTEAGNALKDMMALGASEHWKEVLKNFSGDTEMNPAALLEYFEPLSDWLKAENERLHIPIGWNRTDKVPECTTVES